MEFALQACLLPDDAAVLQFALNGVGYIGVWRRHAILEASVFWGI
jgi:hypothetical protein